MVGLSIDPPPPSHRFDRRSRRGGRAGLVLALLAIVGAFGGGFWVGRKTAPGARETSSPPGSEVAAAAPVTAGTATGSAQVLPPSAAEGRGEAGRTASATSTPTPTTAPTAPPGPTPAQPPASTGPRRLAATISGSLEDSIAGAMGHGERAVAEQLTQVVNRLLVWQLHVAKDGRRGDRIEVLWSPAPAAAEGVPVSAEPVVDAVRYSSSKLGGVVAAYRWQADGSRWARYYRPDGSEIELRLVDGPIADYEQVTSLLKDGRRHKGVDFKTPVGSPVHAPFEGVIERRNWNFAGNGNCLDIKDPATGRHAIFLHLEVLPKELSPGRRVRKGEVIASSGNSGHSFAPHLHYQLEDAGGTVLDPFAIHRTERRALPADQRAKFDAARAALDSKLAG